MLNACKTIICTLTLILISVTSQAQQGRVIEGYIVNYGDGSAVVGAAVVVDNGYLWGISNGDGKFAISNVDRTAIELSVSCMGYVTETINIELTKASLPITIRLKESSLKIDEVVVTALTILQARRPLSE